MCNGVKSDFFRISLLISVWLVSDGSGQMNPAPPPQNGGGTPPGSGTAGGGTPNAGTTNTIGSSFLIALGLPSLSIMVILGEFLE